MLSTNTQPSTRPVVQRVQLMVSNFFDVLEDESVEDVFALCEHPEAVAPQALSEHPEVVAPQCSFLNAYSPIIGNYSKLVRTSYGHLSDSHFKERKSSDVFRSFIDCAFRGEFGVGSSDLLNRYFQAGVGVDSAIKVLSDQKASSMMFSGEIGTDSVYQALRGRWWSNVSTAVHVIRCHRTPYIYSLIKPTYLFDSAPLLPIDHPGRVNQLVNHQFVNNCPDIHNYINARGASMRDHLYYSGFYPWLQRSIKAGSFNPYGNGQPESLPASVDDYDPFERELSDCDFVDDLLDQHARDKVRYILRDKVLAPVTDFDQSLSAVRALSPICTLFYQLYSAKTKTDAIVAAWSYMERMAVEDDYATVKIGLGWASSYISAYKDLMQVHLTNTYEFFQENIRKHPGVNFCKLQSSDSISDMVDFLTQLTVGVQTNARAQSFIWLVAFVFTSISAARSGVFVGFNEYSRRSKDMVERCFALGATGITVSLFVTAIKNCYELVNDMCTNGLTSLWRSEINMVSDLRYRGEKLLERTLVINIQSDFGEIIAYGADLHSFLHDVEINAPKLATRQLGVNFFGIGMNSETNAAILWSSVKKMSVELKTAQLRYKLMLVSITYRKAPFAMAAVGGSSLGKSLWTQAMAAVINNYLGVKHDPSLIFTFNPATEYMDGYKPFQTVVVLDDVATMRPDYCPDGDPQTKAIIPMINNVAMLTPQADLPDKKTCPFVSQAVLLTSNTKDFNAAAYTMTPAALLRRVKYRVILEVDPDFKNTTGGLDQNKARAWQSSQPSGFTSFPPYWRYTVQEMVAVNAGEDSIGFKITTKDVCLLTKATTGEYLQWFRAAWLDHQANQTSAVEQVQSMRNLVMCPACHLPHPHHALDCHDVSDGVVVQSLDVVAALVEHKYSVVFVFFFTLLCVRMYRVFYRFFDGVFIVRDKSLITMAMMEDASNRVSYMASTWAKIGAPAAIIVGTLGALYSWFLVFVSVAYFFIVSFPTVRVKSVLSVRNTMLAATVMIAGGLLLRSLTRKDDAQGAMQQSLDSGPPIVVEKSTCDFSNNDGAARWGDGVCRPYSGESLEVAYSQGTNTSRGVSQDGALVAVKKAIFVAHIVSETKGATYSSTCNGFVYSHEPPVIGLNNHSLSVHRGHGTMSFKLLFLPNNGGEPVNDEFKLAANTFMFSIDESLVVVDHDRDLAMLHVCGLNRRGIAKYMVLGPHQHGGLGPRMFSRSISGSMIDRRLDSYVAYGPMEFGAGDKTVSLKRAYSYAVATPTMDGDSGGLVVLHRGDAMFGEKAGIAIAGFHVAYNVATGRVFCAPLNKDICDSLCGEALTRRNVRLRDNVGMVDDTTLQCLQEFVPGGSEDNIFDLDKGSIGGVLTPVHHKSAINWLEVDRGAVQVFGSIVGDSRTSQGLRSSYTSTRWSTNFSVMSSILGDTANRFSPTVVPQKMLWKVHHDTLKSLLSVSEVPIPDVVMDNAVVGLVNDIISGVSLSGNDSRWSNFGILTVYEAINGLDGVLDSIVWKTGGGFGYSGPKFNKRCLVPSGIPGLNKSGTHYILDDDTMASINAADELLRRGIDPGFVYQTHLKDEIRTTKKVMDCKIRMICGAPIPAIVLTRKYLASLIIFMSQNPLPTECAVGMNSECKQWGDLARYLIEYGGLDRFVAGDYSDFDKNQTLQMTLGVSRVMLNLVLHAHKMFPGKYDAGDLLAIRTLLSGLCYPRYDHFGTILAICGTNPSGNSLTAQRNCLANSLYIRCSFIWLARRCIGMSENLSRCLFARVVRQINYGDDVILAIRENFHWFNHDTIAYALGLWGVPFTHADKSVVVGRPYDLFSEVTFLKRAFVLNHEIGDYLAPLDTASVVKGLHFYTSNNVGSCDQAHAILLRSQVENVLSHGREFYDNFCGEARILASLAGLSGLDLVEATNFTTWDSFKDRWHNSSLNPKFSRFAHYDAPPHYPVNPPDFLAGLI